jgi:hypothetical protein
MVYSPKLSLVSKDSNPTDVGLALGETISFGSLEFTTDHLVHLSLTPLEDDPCAFICGDGA